MTTRTFAIALAGDDRPGLVEQLAGTVAEHGGNWLDARITVLAGQAAGVVLASVPEARAESLREALLGFAGDDLHLRVAEAPARQAQPAYHRVYLELMGQDRPGIVQEVSRVLHRRGINIEDLVTERVSGAMAGGTMFKAAAELEIPDSLSTDTVRADLEALANELMVDLQVRELAEEPDL